MEEWVKTLQEEIWNWLQLIQVQNHPGWIRHCQKGCLFKPGPKAGLGMSCLALKTLHMLGLTCRISNSELVSWQQYILSFQMQKGQRQGYFEDPWLLRQLDHWWRKDLNIRRAETRQAIAALLCTGKSPEVIISNLPDTPSEVKNFITKLDWSTPWHAGSQAGILLTFLHYNSQLTANKGSENHLIKEICQLLDELQDQETGCWRQNSPSSQQLINGAMKVLTAYEFAGIEFPNPERLIDYTLAAVNKRDACHHTDIIYVLHQCQCQTSYRKSEIIAFARERIDLIKKFRKADGGFSFYEDKTNSRYYGVNISSGLPESDIHGTTLFIWALVLISDIIGKREELGWQLPIT